MATFGERIKLLRREKNLTQLKLSEIFLLNKSSISRYENDLQLPDMSTLEAFAKFFNVSVDYLLGKTDIKSMDDLEVPPGYLRIAKEAQERGLTPEDVRFAIDLLQTFRKRDEEAKKERGQ